MEAIEIYPKYSIDKTGTVRNINTGRVKKQSLDKGGYKRVVLYDEKNKRHNVLVHRLVALQFLPVMVGKNYINHKNGDKLDNRIENLEWCTIRENNLHKREILKKSNGSAKKRVICLETGEVFESILDATRIKKLNKGDISHAINRTNNHKTAGGYHWGLAKGII